jgi:hypothetical protein
MTPGEAHHGPNHLGRRNKNPSSQKLAAVKRNSASRCEFLRVGGWGEGAGHTGATRLQAAGPAGAPQAREGVSGRDLRTLVFGGSHASDRYRGLRARGGRTPSDADTDSNADSGDG